MLKGENVIFKKSVWVFHLNTGSCNACDIEILDVITPFHDIERFGMKLVPSPRHADAILLTGPVTLESLPKVVEAVMAVPEPKIIIAIGSCACGGGIWYDTYATLGGVDMLSKILKRGYNTSIDIVYVPGCPPRPQAIIYGIMLALNKVKQRMKRIEYKEE